jgi:uncharacterized iron-regulated membrane protein
VTTVDQEQELDLREATPEPTGGATKQQRKGGRTRPVFMRPRKALVKVHRWLSLALMVWIVIVAITGAWLVESNQFEAWLHPGRFDAGSGDVGAQRAVTGAEAAMPEKAEAHGVTLPDNGRGVYQVYFETPGKSGREEDILYQTAYVDPGSGEVNDVTSDTAGFTWWMYRGHMYLWQDHGPFGVFDPDDGWCRSVKGAEPGGVKGVVCDVIPDGMDLVGWLGVGFIVIIVSGFYLWYWPGVKRWANALRIQRTRGRFTFNMSLHKAIGFVVWVPLLVVAFTGIAFAFPNLNSWYENVTPSQRDFFLWTPSDESVYSSSKPQGREPIGVNKVRALIHQEFPGRRINYLGFPHDEEGVYEAWVTRGFDPWTREGGAGNVYVFVDQFSGKIVYDGKPGDGNVFDQLWDDWSFPLHTGDFGGPVTRVLWFGVGVSPVVLGVTGVTMWVIRRNKRAKRASPAASSSAEASAPEVSV